MASHRTDKTSHDPAAAGIAIIHATFLWRKSLSVEFDSKSMHLPSQNWDAIYRDFTENVSGLSRELGYKLNFAHE